MMRKGGHSGGYRSGEDAYGVATVARRVRACEVAAACALLGERRSAISVNGGRRDVFARDADFDFELITKK